MKFLTFVVLFFSFTSYATSFTSAAENIKTVLNPPKINEVFVPPGFDDLDEVQITYINHSNSSCFIKNYSLAPRIDHKNKVIRISNMSLVLKGDFCKFRDVATQNTLKIGELKVGTYTIEFETEEGKYQKYTDINIHKSKSDQKDDFEYAALDINELTVKVNKEKQEIDLQLPGTFPNGCYAIKEIKVLDDRSENVIEVLPIVEVSTSICTQDIQFFNKKISIPYDSQDARKKLIHIRSADGVAINRVVTLH